MNNKLNLLFILSLLIFNSACVEQKSPEKDINKNTQTTPKLKFTSGIRSIFQDSKGNIWFGSLQEGIALYNQNSFTYFTTNEGLADNKIHTIKEDKKGIIWIQNQHGVSSYDGTKITNHTAPPAANIFPIQGQNSAAKWMKSPDDLWFEAGNEAGVYRYDGQKLNYLPFPNAKSPNPNDNLYATTCIAKGKNNMIWFGTYAGVFGYNGTEFTIINDETLGFDRNIAPLHIRSILEDSKGRLWIGNNGIGVLLRQGNTTINFSEQQNLIHPASKRRGDKSPPNTLEHVFVISEDSKGNIWFSDRDAGIWRYDGTNMKNYTKADGLINDFAVSIYEDKDQKLWFGMADGSVYQFNNSTFEKQFDK